MTNSTLTKMKLLKEIKDVHSLLMKQLYTRQNLLVQDLYRDHFDSIYLEQEYGYLDYDYDDFACLEAYEKENIIDDINLDESLFNEDDFEITKETFVEYQQDLYFSAKAHGYISEEEIYEYWLVSDWLLARLVEKGEIIVNYDDKEQWWGRQTTGQAVDMDYVMQGIAMDILSFRLNVSIEKLKATFTAYDLGSDWFFNC